MEEEAGTKEVINGNDEKNVREEIYTKVVRAGKRTYFFDVKATRKDSEEEPKQEPVDLSAREFTNVDFDDLGKR
jgi:hypothetical protein